MQKVLLAIDGISPDHKIFDYAVQLCRRIKAELNVFQVINPRKYSEYLKTIRKRAGNARKYFESTMVAATFAEAGEHETAKEIMSTALENINRLLPESEKAGVRCHFAVKTGNPAKEIINYVNGHRDVVLTIYDSSLEDRKGTRGVKKQQGVPRKIKQQLAVPLVIVQN
ncbi:MAG: universal stress protein [Deltaproteobacteria bacterium]|nr:universal stress protein [Deltaproteobacteria bacterium]MBW1821060.1 universal stress protein [Deltaproteobacteria bacterium]